MGLSRLGADIRMRHGVVIASAQGGLRGARIELAYQSVGATHQLLMAAALARGETVLHGAAQEPEVVELCEFLRRLGVRIEGDGTKEIRIRGEESLGGARISCMGDRIEAITYLAAGAVTGGRVTVTGISAEAIQEPLRVLSAAGAEVLTTPESITVAAGGQLSAVSFATAPFPGLATDVQPILMATLTKAHGGSEIVETVFENRFGHVAEYRRFGADIRVDGRTAYINGVNVLSAAPVEAMDIRAAAGLVLMGLMADGVTEITEVHHLDRGYDGLVRNLRQLGASIARTPIRGEQEVVYGC
jgi:UDP-N-acetylglucosamine 1-carboxyvinyltransferase